MSTTSLKGKAAIVTGGAQGFGAGIVDKLIEEGAKVLLVDLNQELGSAKANSVGAIFQRADVSQRADWEAILAAVERNFGRLDIVVNNAGTTYSAKSTVDVTEAEFDRCFNVNVKSFFHSVAVLVPYLQKQNAGGSFVTISSSAALRPRPKLTWYNATKGAVSIASKSCALEFAADQIRFNTICQVAGATPLFSQFAGAAPGTQPSQEAVEVFVKSVPMGRMSTPADIANAVAWLASDGSAFITGIDLAIDGGRCV